MSNVAFFITMIFAWALIALSRDVAYVDVGLCVIATVIATNGQHAVNAHKRRGTSEDH